MAKKACLILGLMVGKAMPQRLAGTSLHCNSRGSRSLGGTPCRCDKPAAMPASDDVTPLPTSSWGLPSAGCPGNWTRYWTEVYPQQHRAWKAQGRVVVHCTHHTGLGNYLRSVPGALVYSMITEQALTLHCDDPQIMRSEGGRLVGMAQTVSRFLRGPHFDWNFEWQLPPSAPTVDLYAVMSNPDKFAWNASRGSRAKSMHSVFPRRLFQFTKRMPYFERYFGSTTAPWIKRKDSNLDGCLLRYLFAPKPELLRAAHQATGLHSSGGAELMPLAAMHVRVGDSVFAHDGWRAGGRWFAAAEMRTSPYDANPAAAFACLARLSDRGAPAREGGRGEGGRGEGRGGAARCMGCVVVSDSSEVEECARRLLNGPIVTPGHAVHLSASSHQEAHDTTNVRRIFLDWFLLAQSRSTLLMQVTHPHTPTPPHSHTHTHPHPRPHPRPRHSLLD